LVASFAVGGQCVHFSAEAEVPVVEEVEPDSVNGKKPKSGEEEKRERETLAEREEETIKSNNSFKKVYGVWDWGEQREFEAKDAILIYYEIQLGKIELNPAVVLDAKGIDLSTDSCDHQGAPLFEKVSEFFSVGTDDVGKDIFAGEDKYSKFSPYQIEVTTEPMTPEEVLNSSMVGELENFLENVSRPGASILGTRNQVTMIKENYENGYTFQYSLGVPLAKAGVLIANSGLPIFWERAQKVQGHEEYRSFLALAGMTIASVTKVGAGKCRRTKGYLEPWLVRTNFGDIAEYLYAEHGKDVLNNALKDVMAVANLKDPETTSFPSGVSDGKKFDELAVAAGFLDSADNLPTEMAGLCELAGKMLKDKMEVSKKVGPNYCKIQMKDGSVVDTEALNWTRMRPASPREWVEGVMQGRDLWTDAESELSQGSLSNSVFKSIGAWRMRNPGRVWVEARRRACCKGDFDTEVGLNYGFNIARDLDNPTKNVKKVAELAIKLFGA
jgi:hypothetical protein